MNEPETLERINQFMRAWGWVDSPVAISFLAAGEYNANYRVDGANGRRVLRINHGSQLGLGEDQIAYEYMVLQALAATGVTPRPIACHPHAEPFGGGALLMSFLPGTPLDYRRDLERAAQIFARIHAVPVPKGLIVQADPVTDIARESAGLLDRFADHPRHEAHDQIRAYLDSILELAERTRPLFANEALCIVNTEVNAGNFLIGEAGAYLVDWEKAVASHRYQDLGHFMVPTTTLWKSDIILTPDEKKRFLAAYRRKACPDMDMDELVTKTRVLEKTILLRALAWCFMAWYEYTQTDRLLRNPETLAKIEQYLDNIPWILASVK
ncbi:phosphotransferase family protein [Desulfosarcina sp.]|uniref:phosphotransferase family protein n=1 Tax=Desulfosarcina sp. TaxID=2027861 RepID=UPI003970A90E